MKKILSHPAVLAILLFACESDARTRTETFTGERVYVRDDGRVEVVIRDREGRPETRLVDEGAQPLSTDPVVNVIPDVPAGAPLKVVRRVTTGGGCVEFARTEVDVHVHEAGRFVVRERKIGVHDGLIYYE